MTKILFGPAGSSGLGNEEGVKHTYTKGDRFYIPKGTKHSAKVYAGYASVAFFNQKDRYKKK